MKTTIIEKPLLPNLDKPYNKGAYNRFNDIEQWIRITEGCPNGCQYCRETFDKCKALRDAELKELLELVINLKSNDGIGTLATGYLAIVENKIKEMIL